MNQYIPTVTKRLLIINAIFFAFKEFNLLGINLDVLLSGYYPKSPNFHLYQLITHMFMHANFPHFLFNMLTLYSIGSIVEQTLGKYKFMILYFVSGLGAYVFHQVGTYIELIPIFEQIKLQQIDISTIAEQTKLDYKSFNDLYVSYPKNSIEYQLALTMIQKILGASGAISGIVAAFAVLYPNMKLSIFLIPYPFKAKNLVLFFSIFSLILAILNMKGIYMLSNIAHLAHFGGALTGFLILHYLVKNRKI